MNQHPEVHVQNEILLHVKEPAEALARLKQFLGERRGGEKAVANGFKLLDGQGGENLRSSATDSPLSSWLARHRFRVVVLEREGLARLVSQLKHSQAISESPRGTKKTHPQDR